MKRYYYDFQRFIASCQHLIGRRRQLNRLKYWGLSVILIISIYWGIPAIASDPGTILAQNSTSVTPSRTLQRPTLQVGSKGTEVSELQATLKLLGYYQGSVDGVYSQATADAVTAFQKAAGVNTSGIVDQQTWNRLFPPSQTVEESTTTTTCVCPESASVNATASNTVTTNRRRSVSLPTLELGMRGDAVTGLQERLRVKGFLQSSVDGVFGEETQAAVEAAQSEYELKPDGVVGTQTWLVLLR
ncbi:MAG: peptidoglycan-binding protein [Microcoleaceae cyanobacterium]